MINVGEVSKVYSLICVRHFLIYLLDSSYLFCALDISIFILNKAETQKNDLLKVIQLESGETRT